MRGQQGSLLSESGTKSNRAIHVHCMHACSVASAVSNSATLRTVARQAPLSMRFSRQEYWSGLPWPLPGESSDPGVEPASLMSPALAGGFFTTKATQEAHPSALGSQNQTWDRSDFMTLALRSFQFNLINIYLNSLNEVQVITETTCEWVLALCPALCPQHRDEEGTVSASKLLPVQAKQQPRRCIASVQIPSHLQITTGFTASWDKCITSSLVGWLSILAFPWWQGSQVTGISLQKTNKQTKKKQGNCQANKNKFYYIPRLYYIFSNLSIGADL